MSISVNVNLATVDLLRWIIIKIKKWECRASVDILRWTLIKIKKNVSAQPLLATGNFSY